MMKGGLRQILLGSVLSLTLISALEAHFSAVWGADERASEEPAAVNAALALDVPRAPGADLAAVPVATQGDSVPADKRRAAPAATVPSKDRQAILELLGNLKRVSAEVQSGAAQLSLERPSTPIATSAPVTASAPAPTPAAVPASHDSSLPPPVAVPAFSSSQLASVGMKAGTLVASTLPPPSTHLDFDPFCPRAGDIDEIVEFLGAGDEDSDPQEEKGLAPAKGRGGNSQQFPNWRPGQRSMRDPRVGQVLKGIEDLSQNLNGLSQNLNRFLEVFWIQNQMLFSQAESTFSSLAGALKEPCARSSEASTEKHMPMPDVASPLPLSFGLDAASSGPILGPRIHDDPGLTFLVPSKAASEEEAVSAAPIAAPVASASTSAPALSADAPASEVSTNTPPSAISSLEPAAPAAVSMPAVSTPIVSPSNSAPDPVSSSSNAAIATDSTLHSLVEHPASPIARNPNSLPQPAVLPLDEIQAASTRVSEPSDSAIHGDAEAMPAESAPVLSALVEAHQGEEGRPEIISPAADPLRVEVELRELNPGGSSSVAVPAPQVSPPSLFGDLLESALVGASALPRYESKGAFSRLVCRATQARASVEAPVVSVGMVRQAWLESPYRLADIA